jgi:hypothetical protein
MNLTLEDVYRIGRNAVRLFPAEVPVKPCRQLQAFRVLQHSRGLDMGTPNLGAVATDKDSPYFWSVKWHNNKYNPNALAFDYPILTMFEVFSETSGSPFDTSFNHCFNVEMAVLDVYREDCVDGKQTGCAARPVNAIYRDTGELLLKVLQYFGQSVIATTDVHPDPMVYTLPWLTTAEAEGDIASFEVSKYLLDMLNPNNRNVRFMRVEMPAQKIYGTKVQVKFCSLTCPEVEFNYNINDYGVLAFEAGCRDCE